ncbi:hypothetical protein BA062_07000 [Prauserella flavalba]|uniref:Uncharacterized protein n=1 Tax=Prauserella flavalba TaxID=1477506 RepID=A0A318LUQ3_9PSEU|nr:hypothetical protein BA062_07000 [Prauserella flavalba]
MHVIRRQESEALVAQKEPSAYLANKDRRAHILTRVGATDQEVAWHDLEIRVRQRFRDRLVLLRAELAPGHCADLDDSPLVVLGGWCGTSEGPSRLDSYEKVTERD